jgi:hypothetical protein
MGRLRTGVAAIAVLLAAVGGCGKSGTNASGDGAAPPPSVWPLPDDPREAAQKAGLSMLNREMLDVHYHAHLDVVVRGVRVTVPAGVGIEARRSLISPLHTHDPSGIVHIESAEDIPFTLGQFFTEWGQPLSSTRVGPVTIVEGEQLRVYRNGDRVPGDPAKLRFTEHAEIVVWVGPAGAQPKVPTSYEFPDNL